MMIQSPDVREEHKTKPRPYLRPSRTDDLPAWEFVCNYGKSYPRVRTDARLRDPHRGSLHTAASAVLEFQQFRYVEGYAIPADRATPQLHAWLEDDTGGAVEIEWLQPGTSYVGVSVPGPFLWRRLAQRGFFGLLEPLDDSLRLRLASESAGTPVTNEGRPAS